MTPKEKAIELVDKFKDYANDFYTDFASQEDLIYNIKSNAKECALIAVDDILESDPLEPNDAPEWLQPGDWFSEANISAKKYWQEVKQEIENI